MQSVSLGDKIHEMSNPIVWKNRKKYLFVICRIFPESAEG